jgi:hypothetical protein
VTGPPGRTASREKFCFVLFCSGSLSASAGVRDDPGRSAAGRPVLCGSGACFGRRCFGSVPPSIYKEREQARRAASNSFLTHDGTPHELLPHARRDAARHATQQALTWPLSGFVEGNDIVPDNLCLHLLLTITPPPHVNRASSLVYLHLTVPRRRAFDGGATDSSRSHHRIIFLK